MFLNVPRLERTEENALTISGCRFKFHEYLDDFATYVVYDENLNELTSVPTALINNNGEVDSYQFQPTVVTSYMRAGSYFKCKLFDSETMHSPTSSAFSELVPVMREYTLLLNIF